MPTYEYLCRRCTRVFEIRMTLEEKKNAKTACPNCGSEDISQHLYGVNFAGEKAWGENGPANAAAERAVADERISMKHQAA